MVEQAQLEQAQQEQPSAAPTVAEILSWNPEERGELPEDYRHLPVDDVRTAVQQAQEQAAQRERERITAEHRAAEERRLGAERDRATLQSDIDYAADIDRRIVSDDDAVRRSALLEKQQNEERYTRGLSTKYQMAEAEAARRILAAHYNPILEAVKAQHQPVHDNIQEWLGKSGGNPVLAAIEYGKTLGVAEAKASGFDEGRRAQRIDFGQRGAPDMGDAPQPRREQPRDPRTIPLDEYEKLDPVERGNLWYEWDAVQNGRRVGTR
jgi:hypothetical protein